MKKVLRFTFSVVLFVAVMVLLAWIAFFAGNMVGAVPGTAILPFTVWLLPALLVGWWMYRAGKGMGRSEQEALIASYRVQVQELGQDLEDANRDYDNLLEECEDINELEELYRESSYLRESVRDLEKQVVGLELELK